MYRIIKIGMDVHSTNFTLCAMESLFMEEDRVLAELTTEPDHRMVLAFIERLKQKYRLESGYEIECGYEAGCLGYSLYEKLAVSGVRCVILAPITMSAATGALNPGFGGFGATAAASNVAFSCVQIFYLKFNLKFFSKTTFA